MRSLPLARLAVIGVVVVVLTAGLAGCTFGPAKGEVRGKITFKNKPVTEGTVNFVNPTVGGGGEAQIGPDGSYAVEGGLVVGEYIVMINPLQVMDSSDPRTPPTLVEKPAPNIPQKYRNPTSPLKVTVKEGKNDPFDFDLKP